MTAEVLINGSPLWLALVIIAIVATAIVLIVKDNIDESKRRKRGR